MDAKNLYDGIGRLVSLFSSRELPKPVNSGEEKSITENGDLPSQPSQENGVASVEQTEDANAHVVEEESPTLQTDENPSATV